MKIVVATGHGPEYSELASVTYPAFERYCAKHSYDRQYDPNRQDKDACKVAMYQEAYATGRYAPDDVWVWNDTDALIMNSEKRLETIVYEHMPRSVHYLIGTDVNGINSGVFAARFSPEAYLFMTVSSSISIASGWADQCGIEQVALKYPHNAIYKEIPGKVWNCNLYHLKGWDYLGEFGNFINRYEPGDFILHLAGCEEPTRSRILREYAKLAK